MVTWSVGWWSVGRWVGGLVVGGRWLVDLIKPYHIIANYKIIVASWFVVKKSKIISFASSVLKNFVAPSVSS